MTGQLTKPTGRRPRTWTRLNPLLRLLILTQLAFIVGFFAVLPFLAEHLGTAIGLAGLIVLAGSSATGSLLDTGLPPAVPWLILAAVPAASMALLPRRR